MNLLKPLIIITQLLFSIEAKADNLDINILTVSLAGVSSANPQSEKSPKLYLDALYRLIERHYVGTVTYKEISPNRIIQELSSPEKVQCLINVKSKSYEGFSIFISVAPAINPRFIYNPQKVKSIPQIDGMVDIDKIITERIYVGGIAKGRPYSDSLAPYLEKGIANKTIKEINSSTYGTNLVGMLGSERVDYIIEYPTVLYAYTGPAKSLKLKEAVIHQGKNIDELGFYCSNNAKGESVARHLDQAILKVLKKDLDTYLEITAGFDVGSQQRELSQRVNEYILKRLK